MSTDKRPRGRQTPAPPAKPAPAEPLTIPKIIEQLSQEIQTKEAQVQDLSAALGTAREQLSFMRGQLLAYSSIQLVEPNPATFTSGSEGE